MGGDHQFGIDCSSSCRVLGCVTPRDDVGLGRRARPDPLKHNPGWTPHSDSKHGTKEVIDTSNRRLFHRLSGAPDASVIATSRKFLER